LQGVAVVEDKKEGVAVLAVFETLLSQRYQEKQTLLLP
jgi:hypothetical protein